MINLGLEYEYLLIIGFSLLLSLLLINILKLISIKFNDNNKLKNFLKTKIVLIIDIFLFIFLLYISIDLTSNPDIEKQFPKNDESIINNREQIYVLFDRPIDIDKIKPQIYPEVEGKWELEPANNLFPYIKRKVVFYPEMTLPLNEKIFIYYAGIANPYNNNEPWEFSIDSYTPNVISKVEAMPPIGTVDVLTDNVTLEFSFNEPSSLYYDWDLEISPLIEHSFKIEPSKLTVYLNEKLSQSTKYIYNLKAIPARFNFKTNEVVETSGEFINLFEGNFETVKEPLLSSVEPKGTGVMINSPIIVTFDTEMIEDEINSYLNIEPHVLGDSNWRDKTTFELNHEEPFIKDTEYKLTIKSGLKSLTGGIIENDYTSSFTTIGKVKLISSNPANLVTGVSVSSNIYMNFDQEVDHNSAQSNFSISPNIEGKFSWDNNTMIFNPNSNLNYSTKYTISVKSGVKTIHGLDSVEDFNFVFTTQAEQFKLNVPVYYQKLRFSCNLEATRMALAYRGVYKDVMTLYSQINKDSTPYDEVNNIFGDPYTGYTGDIYGVTKGYGVYWGPISNLISKYRSNSIKTGWNLSGLLQEVRNNNPVVIWAHNGYSYAGNEYHWTTPYGKDIRAITGMHSYVVVGYKGPIEDPTHIILNDSNRGVWTVTKSTFLGLWGYFNNTGVVVY